MEMSVPIPDSKALSLDIKSFMLFTAEAVSFVSSIFCQASLLWWLLKIWMDVIFKKILEQLAH